MPTRWGLRSDPGAVDNPVWVPVDSGPVGHLGFHMHTASRAIVTVAAAISSVLVAAPVSPTVAADGYRWASAVDGDTINLPSGRSVRLLGYDTPEVGQCGYDEALARMETLVGRPVKLVNRSGTDKYGRILSYVRTRNGRDIGAVMLRRGLAVARYDRGCQMFCVSDGSSSERKASNDEHHDQSNEGQWICW